MATTRRIVTIALAVGALAACTDGGGGNTDGTSPDDGLGTGPPIAESVVLTSDDGVVTVEIPAGSVREGTALALETVPVSGDLGIPGTTAIGPAYRLVPAAVVFPEPVEVTYRLPAGVIGRDDTAIPVLISVQRSDRGTARLPEQRTGFDAEGGIEHRTSIVGFGTLLLVDGGVDLTFEPDQVVDLVPGDGFTATVRAGAETAALQPFPDYSIEVRFTQSGVTSTTAGTNSVDGLGGPAVGDQWASTAEYTCEVVGTGTHGVDVAIRVTTGDDAAPSAHFITLTGESSCGDVGRSDG